MEDTYGDDAWIKLYTFPIENLEIGFVVATPPPEIQPSTTIFTESGVPLNTIEGLLHKVLDSRRIGKFGEAFEAEFKANIPLFFIANDNRYKIDGFVIRGINKAIEYITNLEFEEGLVIDDGQSNEPRYYQLSTKYFSWEELISQGRGREVFHEEYEKEIRHRIQYHPTPEYPFVRITLSPIT